MLDAKITQGSYWGGSQIPYWLYLALVIFPFTGLFGIDHLVLRSPITAVLKWLSLIPLFGFWYFYDIAQACGERELIEKYGIAVPFYGPVGIGAGIFSGTDGIPESPKDSPQPWLFIAYSVATFLFFAIPLNKFVIGDYQAGWFYTIICLFGIGFFLSIPQGLYDIYNLIFNTKDVLESGVARIPGITEFFIGPYPKNSLLATRSKHINQEETTSAFGTIVTTLKNTASTVGKVASEVGTGVGKVVSGVGTGVAVAAGKDLGIPINIKENLQAAVKKVGEVLPEQAGEQLYGLGKGAVEVATAQKTAVVAAADVASAAGSAASGLAKELKDPDTIHTLITGSVPAAPVLPTVPTVPTVPALTTTKPAQHGGSLISNLSITSIIPSAPVLIFSVALMAFSGYVFYMFRNTYSKPEKSDDPPREPRAVRKSAERKQQES